MEKAFSERCKHFGLQFKPSASVELPFGTTLSNSWHVISRTKYCPSAISLPAFFRYIICEFVLVC
jgi:hypothetical protein